MKKTYFIFFVFIGAVLSMSAQDKRAYYNAIKSALHVHDTASLYESSHSAAKILEEAASNEKDDWLANYWAAYLYTQIGRYKDAPEGAGKYTCENALKQLDVAQKRYKGDSAAILSDFHALKGFIYYVHTWYDEYEDKDSYYEKRAVELKSALKLNPDNPLVYTLLGTEMLRSESLKDVVAGRALLNQANTLFKKVNKNRALTTQWNEEWLRFFWLDYADKRLSETVNKS